MRRFRRIFLENASWSPPFFNEKPLFLPISYKKKPEYFLILMQKRRTRTETPVQLTKSHGVSKGPINGHGDPMAPIPGQRWFNDGLSLRWNQARKKSFKLGIDMFMWWKFEINNFYCLQKLSPILQSPSRETDRSLRETVQCKHPRDPKKHWLHVTAVPQGGCFLYEQA